MIILQRCSLTSDILGLITAYQFQALKFIAAQGLFYDTLEIIEDILRCFAFGGYPYMVFLRFNSEQWQHLPIVKYGSNALGRQHFCAQLVQFYRVLVFSILQFFTQLVQFCRPNGVTSIEEIPLLHIPQVARRESLNIGDRRSVNLDLSDPQRRYPSTVLPFSPQGRDQEAN